MFFFSCIFSPSLSLLALGNTSVASFAFISTVYVLLQRKPGQTFPPQPPPHQTMSASHHQDGVECKLLRVEALKTVLVLGSTGTGKSTILNMLFNDEHMPDSCKNPLKTGNAAGSATKQTTTLFDHRKQHLYLDTVGLGDPELFNEEIVYDLRELVGRAKLGFHAVIVVAKFGRVSAAERANIRAITSMFAPGWKSNAALVLTHYDGEFDTESQAVALRNWAAGDRDMEELLKNFASVILADNSLGRNEEANRPFRKACLSALQAFIASKKTTVQPAPKTFFETIQTFLDIYFGLLRLRRNAERLSNCLQLLARSSRSTITGTCCICLENINLDELVQTSCGHPYHGLCIKREIEVRPNKICPYCKASFTAIYQTAIPPLVECLWSA